MNFWFDTADDVIKDEFGQTDAALNAIETAEDADDFRFEQDALESAQEFGLYTDVDEANPQPLNTAGEIEAAEKARWE